VSLIDQFLPASTRVSHHQRAVHASVWRTFVATKELDLARSPLIRLLVWLRGVPLLLGSAADQPRNITVGGLLAAGFVLLGEEPGRELVLGIAGQFWRPGGAIKRLAPNDFAAFATAGFTKVVWGFQMVEQGVGRTLLATETRVACYGEEAERRFARYWMLVRLGSGLIRREALRLIAAGAERASGARRAV
jgi:hypothetical protein